jgi:hypothetical protein
MAGIRMCKMEEAGQWVELQLDGGKVFVFYGTVW